MIREFLKLYKICTTNIKRKKETNQRLYQF
jgi:hypothetical protein